MFATQQPQQFQQQQVIPSFNIYNPNTYSLLIKKKKKRSPFSPEEDLVLKKLVENSKIVNWTEIAARLPGRNSRQCRDRYQHYLDPSVTHGNWTPEEDALILKLYKENGPCWALMSLYLKGRNNNSIKNRYNNHIKNGNITYYDSQNTNDDKLSISIDDQQIESSPKPSETKTIEQITQNSQPSFESNELMLFDDDEIQSDDPFFCDNFFEYFSI